MATEDFRPRATRYEFGAVILYRHAGENLWREGWTVNVSRTGVLFMAPPPELEKGTAVEMVIVLPDFGAAGVARIRSTGHIVRCCGPAASGQISMAATIEQYRFLRPDEAASPEFDPVGHRS